jgi:hypothetical protein
MNRQVLVPLKKGDRIEEILPYVEDVAQSGTKVIFLVHLGTNRFKELAGQLLAIQSGLPVNFNTENVASENRAPGLSIREKTIRRVTQELHYRGVTIEVKFYSGSLARLVRECMGTEPIQFVMLRSAQSRVLGWLHAIAHVLKIAKPSLKIPVLLLHPNDVVRRQG